jgi:hypothetical protein
MERRMYDSAGELLCGALSAGEAAVVPEATAGLALLHRARGDLVEALMYAERIGALDSHEVGRADDPTWVMLARYQVLRESGSHDAEAALGATWQRVQSIADRIKDPALRASYLSANTTNRLLAIYREHNGAAATPTAGLHDATDDGGSDEPGDTDDEEQHTGGTSSGGAPPHRSEDDHASSGS